MKIFRISATLGLVYFLLHSFLYPDWSPSKFKGLIPENIEVTKVLETGDNALCRTAIFELSQSIIDNIRKNSLSAFADSKHARDYKDDRERLYSYYTYSSWKETPAPIPKNELAIRDIWFSDCGSSDKDLSRKVSNSLKASGSYYAFIQDGGLIVIPNLGLAIVTYFHN